MLRAWNFPEVWMTYYVWSWLTMKHNVKSTTISAFLQTHFTWQGTQWWCGRHVQTSNLQLQYTLHVYKLLCPLKKENSIKTVMHMHTYMFIDTHLCCTYIYIYIVEYIYILSLNIHTHMYIYIHMCVCVSRAFPNDPYRHLTLGTNLNG